MGWVSFPISLGRGQIFIFGQFPLQFLFKARFSSLSFSISICADKRRPSFNWTGPNHRVFKPQRRCIGPRETETGSSRVRGRPKKCSCGLVLGFSTTQMGGVVPFFYQLCISVSVSAGPEEEEEKEEEKKTNGSIHKMCSQLMLLL